MDLDTIAMDIAMGAQQGMGQAMDQALYQGRLPYLNPQDRPVARPASRVASRDDAPARVAVTEKPVLDVPSDGIMRYEMAVMGRKGDTKVLWDPNNPDEVAAARQQFDDLVGGKRFLAFAVKKKGGQGAQVREFDPAAGSLIMIPPMMGGEG